jgi:hypothetical protein
VYCTLPSSGPARLVIRAEHREAHGKAYGWARETSEYIKSDVRNGTLPASATGWPTLTTMCSSLNYNVSRQRRLGEVDPSELIAPAVHAAAFGC